MTRPADLDPFVAIALEAADLAGSVIRPHFRTAVPADQKSDDSPVTIADRGAEEAMRAMLRNRCPDCGILGEEFGLERPEAPLRWVLDPIDGTRAFITGRPIFATLVALMHGDEPLIGIIDQPVTRERWVGVAGRPTTFSGPIGGSAGTRACPEIGNAELSCTSPELLKDDLPRFQALQGAVKRTTWGGDAYGYGLLALGQLDIVVERSLKVWDWAALMPVVEGAGGAMTDWQGGRLRSAGDGRVIAVGDRRLLPGVVSALG
ncbi:MAG TPA: inositol monophosphatase family protein [Rhodopila sp.]|uniref:inositol monophosphatase family protein n=1 Tax=Rhodopila sp. TaxID=2480087 RepID=UPI002BC30B6B|nr:inositol monophosphatase family protein [Rhodopila sp.]HVY18024.1 inositol monophosphatase family protein [Rhodopila sp.]